MPCGSFDTFRDSASHVWMGGGSSASTLGQHVGQVLARVFVAAEKQHHLVALRFRYNVPVGL